MEYLESGKFVRPLHQVGLCPKTARFSQDPKIWVASAGSEGVLALRKARLRAACSLALPLAAAQLPRGGTAVVEQLTTHFGGDMCCNLAVSQQMKGRDIQTTFENQSFSRHLQSWEFFARTTSIKLCALLFTCGALAAKQPDAFTILPSFAHSECQLKKLILKLQMVSRISQMPWYPCLTNSHRTCGFRARVNRR